MKRAKCVSITITIIVFEGKSNITKNIEILSLNIPLCYTDLYGKATDLCY
jgi:hypothetical protein